MSEQIAKEILYRCVAEWSMMKPQFGIAPSPSVWYFPLSNFAGRDYFTNKAQAGAWDRMTVAERGKWIVGQLKDCADIVPRSLQNEFAWLDVAPGAKYSEAVEVLSKAL